MDNRTKPVKPDPARLKKAEKLKIPSLAASNEFGGVGGVYMADVCVGGHLKQVYVDFGPGGQVIATHYIEVGSC